MAVGAKGLAHILSRAERCCQEGPLFTVIGRHHREEGVMATRQTRIFVPWGAPYDHDWCATLLGRVIGPLVDAYQGLEWFWFSRYVQEREGSSENCDLSKIPGKYELRRKWKSVRFRYRIRDAEREGFEDKGSAIICEEGCAISDWRAYDAIADLGSNRFLGGDRSSTRRAQRMELVSSFLHVVSKLVLHALTGPDDGGRFSLEQNDHELNPLGSSFESMHHMFCNVTAVPWRVRLVRDFGSGGLQERYERSW